MARERKKRGPARKPVLPTPEGDRFGAIAPPGQSIWYKLVGAELALANFKQEWLWKRIPLNQFDWKAAEENRGRIFVGQTEQLGGKRPVLTRYDPDRVSGIGIEMIDRHAFPGLVVNYQNGKYSVVDGVHRLYGAKEAGLTEVEAYVISTDNAVTLDALPMALNQALNGVRCDEKQLLEQSSYMMTQWGWTPSQVRAVYGVSERAIINYRRLEKVNLRLLTLGIEPVRMVQGIRMQLGLIDNDNIFGTAAVFLAHYKMTIESADEYFADLKSRGRTEDEARAVTAEWVNKMSTQASPRPLTPKKPIFRNLVKSLKGLRTLFEKGKTRRGLQVATQAEAEEVKSLVHDISERCREIFGS